MRIYFKIRMCLIFYLRTLHAFRQIVFFSLNKAKQDPIIQGGKCY